MKSSIVQRPMMTLTIRPVHDCLPCLPSTGYSTSPSQFCGDLVDGIGFDHIAGLDVAEVLHADAALVALLDLANVVLESAQRPQPPLIHHDIVADHPNAYARTCNGTVDDVRARNRTGF